jgi:hypothetical protein
VRHCGAIAAPQRDPAHRRAPPLRWREPRTGRCHGGAEDGIEATSYQRLGGMTVGLQRSRLRTVTAICETAWTGPVTVLAPHLGQDRRHAQADDQLA